MFVGYPYTAYRRKGEAWRFPGQIEHEKLPDIATMPPPPRVRRSEFAKQGDGVWHTRTTGSVAGKSGQIPDEYWHYAALGSARPRPPYLGAWGP